MTPNAAVLLRRTLDEWKARGWRDEDGTAKRIGAALAAGASADAAAKEATRPFLSKNRIRRSDVVDAIRVSLPNRVYPVAVVLTSLDIEYLAVRRHLADVEQTTSSHGTLFEMGLFRGSDIAWRLAIAQIGPGNTGAAIETTRALERFRPELLLFVGIAGSLRSELALGAVVIAQRVYSYEGGRASADGWKARPIVFPTNHRLEQQATALARDWSAPRAIVKPIAAGEALVGSSRSEIAGILNRNFNDAVAVDMESAGVYEAAHRAETPALAIRAISDHLDDKSASVDACAQPLAARNAAAFAAALLGSGREIVDPRA